jgi:flavodoxin
MRKIFNLYFLICCIVFTIIPSKSFAKSDTLLIYYSRTGKTELVAETLNEKKDFEILEIEELKDRSGTWGYISAVYDAFMHNHSAIKPEKIDISDYDKIIIASPVWSWNLSTPIHTLFEKNSFAGKSMILITTANIHIMKYDKFGEDSNFIKRFLKNYLRKKSKAARDEVNLSGGKFVGHYHIETKNKTKQEIINESKKCLEYVKGVFSKETFLEKQSFFKTRSTPSNQ